MLVTKVILEEFFSITAVHLKLWPFHKEAYPMVQWLSNKKYGYLCDIRAKTDCNSAL